MNGSNWEVLDPVNSLTDDDTKTLSFDRVKAKYIRYTVKTKSPGITGLTDFKVFYRYSDELLMEDNLAGVSMPGYVTGSFTLPSTGSLGLDIIWSSSNTDAITDKGVVTRQSGDVLVNMTASVNRNGKSIEKVYIVRVVGTGNSASSGSSAGGGGGGGGGSSLGTGRSGIVSSGGTGFSGVLTQPVRDTEEPPSVFGFTDIPEEHWAKDYIYKLYSRGIINGTADNTFEPDRPISRAELVKLIVKAFNIPNGEGADFDDVRPDSWYYDYVMAASGAGIVNGISESVFDADSMVKRMDMAVMLKRLIDYKGIEPDKMLSEPLVFRDDLEIADYAIESIELLTMSGLMFGNSEGLFLPDASATRAEAAKMIYVIGAAAEQ